LAKVWGARVFGIQVCACRAILARIKKATLSVKIIIRKKYEWLN